MNDQFQRSISLVGEKALEFLTGSKVAVFGVGGVGGFAVEALARAGVGTLTIVDKDCVDITNLNRQIVALHSTYNLEKVNVLKERIEDINPVCMVNAHLSFFLPETADTFDFVEYDYVLDAVDTLAAKVELAKRCCKVGTPIISAMGMGNKMRGDLVRIGDIYETTVCPLARNMRRELRKLKISGLKVVYSTENPAKISPPGSMIFAPSVAGIIMAQEAVRDLIKCVENK